MEFKSFGEIHKASKIEMSITQKIHGSNAQIFIVESPTEGEYNDAGQDFKRYDNVYVIEDKIYRLFVGSRTRWITPEKDNFGFARFVYDNAEEFIRKLGPGRHYGEWSGPGINSGEGLAEKTLVLFDWWKFPPERPLPPKTVVVPLLYKGEMSAHKIEEVMADLKATGSKLVPGFTRPEGIVIMLAGTRYKKVFEAEETQWKKGDGTKEKLQKLSETLTVDHLLQPIRLEKLLSRDEVYLQTYPNSLGHIASAYINDLVKEEQIVGTEDEIKAYRKALGSPLYKMIKAILKEQYGKE